jgi:hypothetical protein
LFDISKSRYVPCIFPNNLHRVWNIFLLALII